jgi:RNA polymerase sigma factor (TIGR02999 family)
MENFSARTPPFSFLKVRHVRTWWSPPGHPLTPQSKRASIARNVATQTGQLTELLRRGSQGDQAAMDQVIPLVYQELRRLAARHLRKQPSDHSHQPTSLVHEAYLRLVDRSQAEVRCRTHFFNLASTVMRQILVDHARARLASKRGGRQLRVEFEEALVASNEKARDVVALDESSEGFGGARPTEGARTRTSLLWRSLHRRNR